MDGTRREFMKSVGITMLGLAGARSLGGCRGKSASSPQDVRGALDSSAAPGIDAGAGAAVDATTAEAAPDAQEETLAEGNGAVEAGGTGWDRVRGLWYGLHDWEQDRERFNVPSEQSEADRDRRKAEHRAALDGLVAAGGLRTAIAERLVVAFDEAAFHVWRTGIMATCYDPTQAGVRMQEGRGRILGRLAALKDMLDQGVVSESAVADSRAALEREIVFFDKVEELERLEGDARWAAERELVDTIDAGGVPPDADDTEAARILVEVLLGHEPGAGVAATVAADSGWDGVRACWTGLLAWQAQPERWNLPEGGAPERDRRKAEQRAVLEALVAAGKLREPVAEHLATAFDEAVFHVWRSSGGMTCYRMGGVSVDAQDGRDRILQRAAALDGLVERGVVNEEMVADSRAAFERSIVLFDKIAELAQLQGRAREELEGRLGTLLDEGGIPPDADEAEAARILVEVLLGRQ
jgi:hypothetical protein